jgi:tetratricopeptide (TPR) repeat protein/predicted Ser/Thr protein kinase
VSHSADFRIGSELAGYRVEALLGRGGMGVVYRALDLALDRPVALKILSPELAEDVRFRERFLTESRLAASLDHPNIVPVYDAGEVGGELYIAMRYVEGSDLKRLLAGGPLAKERAVALVSQVARALDAAHERGLVHRDVKPSNVLIDEREHVYLADFGLSRRLGEAGAALGVAQSLGTVDYVSPEQIRGEQADGRADLYSLGCLLYECLAGKPPFVRSSDAATLFAHLEEEPPGLPQLDKVMSTALAKEPDDRYQSGHELVEAARWPVFAEERGPFVGRDRELERLRDAVDDALAGHGRLVMLVGEPGIGKTQTAIELGRYAVERGARVLWGRCYEGEGAPSYWPWVQAIRAYVGVCDPGLLHAELGGGAAALAEVVPELREGLTELRPPPVLADEKQARFRFLDSLASFLRRVADRQPLMLVLDDLHAADAGSLMVLEFVAHEVTGTHLLLVGTYRDIELGRGHPLSQTLAELTREQLFERVLLGGLTERDVERFLAATVGVDPPEELVRTVHRQTEGNPLFVTEIVRLLDQEGKLTPEAITESRDWSVRVPEGVREVIGRRLDRLSPSCNEILRLASVIGREFGLDQLAKLPRGPSDEKLLEAVEEALAARVVEELPGAAGRFRFTHALVQEVLAAELSTTRRARLHAVIADALEDVYGDDAEAHAAELAYHFAEAATVEKLIRYSRLAGEQAYTAHAYEDAIAHFQRALTAKEGKPMDDETAGLLFALVRSEFLGRQRYDLEEVLARMRRAFEYYAEAGDTHHAIEVAAHPIPPVWGETQAPQLLSRALAMVPPDSLDAGRILANVGRFAGGNDGDYQGACDAFERSLAVARQHGDESLERRVLALAAGVDWWHLRWEECIAKSTHALELAQAADDQQTEMYARAWLARNAAIRGDLPNARAHAAISLELADRLRERYWLATARVNSFWLNYLEGDWEAGRRLSDAGLRLQPRDARNLGLRTLLEYQLGEAAQGEAFLERLLEAMRVTAPGSTVEHSEAAATIALVGQITGQHERFDLAEAAAATVLSSSVHIPIFDINARIALAILAVERSDAAAAAALYPELESQSGTVLIRLGMAADRLLGLLALTMEDFDTACANFEAALSFCDRSGYPPEYAWTAFDYAVALLARGQPADQRPATKLHAEALATARALGMSALEERIIADGRS